MANDSASSRSWDCNASSNPYRRRKTLTLKQSPISTSKGKERIKDGNGDKAMDCDSNICGICLSENGKEIRGRIDCCNHYFCFICIMEWSRVESLCPMCKQRFSTIRRPPKSGVFLHERIVNVPVRDKGLHPLGNETNVPSNPYAHVDCTECHSSLDENLLLICDLCDSAAHTYCVGLGATVPRGDWYCHDCTICRNDHTSSQIDTDYCNQESSIFNKIQGTGASILVAEIKQESDFQQVDSSLGRTSSHPEQLIPRTVIYEQSMERPPGEGSSLQSKSRNNKAEVGEISPALEREFTPPVTSARSTWYTGTLLENPDNHVLNHVQRGEMVRRPDSAGPSDDGVGPSQPAPKRTRGLTKCLSLCGLPEGECLFVSTDALGQPIGPNASQLSSFLGTLARDQQLLPVDVHDWRMMDDGAKTLAWERIQARFDIDSSTRAWIMQSLSKKWRDYKASLKIKYYNPLLDQGAQYANCPGDVELEQWHNLVQFWDSEQGQRQSVRIMDNRFHRTMPHTSGTKSFARVRAEEQPKSSSQTPPSRTQLFVRTHTHRDGMAVNDESAQKIMATNDGRIPGGPTTADVLRGRQQHRSRVIWDGEIDYVDEPRVRYHSLFFSEWDVREPRKSLAVAAGFGFFQQFNWKHHDVSLCYALAERFWPQTCTFHFPFGEMAITLEDTLHCIGLSITGQPVTLHLTGREDYTDLIIECLGVPPPDAEAASGRIKLFWLRQHYGRLPQYELSPDQALHYTRAYLLALCGATLFPDSTGTYVSASLLYFFRDLSQTASYAWGAAVLCYLYNSLRRFVNHKTKRIHGCTPLLQVWAHERLPVGRPVLKDTRPRFPRALRWMTENRVYQSDPHHNVLSYRTELDFLTPNMVLWTPYYPIPDNVTPSVKAARDDSLHRSCVIFLNFLEYHPADRCMRQFGLHQRIPDPPLEWGRTGKRSTRLSPEATTDWAERFERYRVDDYPCPDLNAPWPSEDFRSWYGCPRVHNPALQFVEPRFMPRGYTDDLYTIYRDRCYAEATAISDLIQVARSTQSIPRAYIDELGAIMDRLTLLPPLPFQIPRPGEPVRQVPHRSSDRRRHCGRDADPDVSGHEGFDQEDLQREGFEQEDVEHEMLE